VDEIADGQSALLECVERRAVAVAPDHDSVEPVDPGLPARQYSVVGSNVLDEEQAPARCSEPETLPPPPRRYRAGATTPHCEQHEQ